MRSVQDIFRDNTPPFLIAEVGLGHDGSLGFAHSFVDAVATTGADAIKFQTHIADAESSYEEKFRVPFSYQDAGRFDYWKRTSFTLDQWLGLKKHAEDKGLVFLSSPFSVQAVDLLDSIGVVAWKIASGELDSRRMLERIAKTGKPVLASTGMCSMSEVDGLVDRLTVLAPNRFAILQCTTEYPTPPEKVGMNVFDDYSARYKCPIGLSDHSGMLWPSIIAASRGARVLEVHVTLSQHMFGPDVSSSLTVEKLTELISALGFVDVMMKNGIAKDALAESKRDLKALFSKSAVTTRAFKAGEFIDDSSVEFLKPGIGLNEAQFDNLSGRPLAKDIPAKHFLKFEDFL